MCEYKKKRKKKKRRIRDYIGFLAFKPFLVGVDGLFGLAVPILFLSDGLSIWNEHIRVSSTLIIAPALSNSPQ